MRIVRLLTCCLACLLSVGCRAQAAAMPYRDANLPLEQRVEDLLGRMTIEEKIGQINMPCLYEKGLGKTIPERMEAVQKFTAGTWIVGLGPGGGFFTLSNQLLHEGTRQQAEFLNKLQHIACEQTRLGIPLLQTEEGTHGVMCSGATIFPEGPALGSTWNLTLLSNVYATVAKEARALGVHQSFTLVIEPNRDPRLGRNEEAYSEDAFVCARIAEAVVHAMQGTSVAAADKVVAGLCHYPGQSQPVSGMERGAMDVSERMLREVFLPPWQAGIQKAGALGVMATYPAIDGLPCHASEKWLTTVLRQEYGFDGLVMSEGGGIGTLLYEGIASSPQEAGALALAAGVDVGISYESAYMLELAEAVGRGKVPVQLLDRAVRRILKQKFTLGLFERPYVDVENAIAVVHRAAHQELALTAARESLVLLKNDKELLPLSKELRTVAVIGPNADEPLNQLGDYSAMKVTQPISTVLDGVRKAVSAQTKVSHVKGCSILGTRLNELAKAKEAAANADVAIVVVGESGWSAPGGASNGEGSDSATLELTGLQEDLVRTVHSTGTPMVLVLINGRALAIRWATENVPAILEAWLPGERGGQAVAEVLFGDVNPSGRLPVTFPRHAGQLPAYYNHKKSKHHWVTEERRAYTDLPATPLYPFGFGLSYTRFEYSNLKLSAQEIVPTDPVEVQVEVKNTGERAGAEVVQVYIQDVISSVSTPVKQLRAFAKVTLQPGETRRCTFKLLSEDLALFDRDLKQVVEPGEFRVMVGASSADIRLQSSFHVKP